MLFNCVPAAKYGFRAVSKSSDILFGRTRTIPGNLIANAVGKVIKGQIVKASYLECRIVALVYKTS